MSELIEKNETVVVDRTNWAAKSQRAIEREVQAKYLFDQFLLSASAETKFPFTQEVIPPQVHLTGPCWKTFKEYVTSKYCHAKRREATQEERKASGTKRKGKVYIIECSVPFHPSILEQEGKKLRAAADKKAEARKKQEQAKSEKNAQAQFDHEFHEHTKREYDIIVASLPSNNNSSVLKNVHPNETKTDDEDDDAKPTAKKRKISVPIGTLVAYAKSVHLVEVNQIREAVFAEKAQIVNDVANRMNAKEDAMIAAAEKRLQTIVGVIDECSEE